MKIICDKTLLGAAIDGVSRAVTLRSTIPVLEGILLKAEGFNLTLTGYDMELGIVTTIEANVLEPGDIVLNAKLLSDMVRRMPAGQISISSADNGKTTIQGGVAQFEIQSMPASDFPQLPNTGAEETMTIKTGVFREMVERTLYAVSQDEKTPRPHRRAVRDPARPPDCGGGPGRIPAGHRGAESGSQQGDPHHRPRQDHERGAPGCWPTTMKPTCASAPTGGMWCLLQLVIPS